MLKKIFLSLSEEIALMLSVRTTLPVSLNPLFIIYGRSTKSDVVNMWGEPQNIAKDPLGKERFIYDRSGGCLDITFDKNVVWDSHECSAN